MYLPSTHSRSAAELPQTLDLGVLVQEEPTCAGIPRIIV